MAIASTHNFIVTSPVVDGRYTESVRRALSGSQIASLRNRGFRVRPTAQFLRTGVLLLDRPPVPVGTQIARVPRRGFVAPYRPRRHTPVPGIIHKSSIFRRRTFAEPKGGFVFVPGNVPKHTSGHRSYYVSGQRRNISLRKGSAEILARTRGWRLTLLPPGNHPLGSAGSVGVAGNIIDKSKLSPGPGTDAALERKRLEEKLMKEREENYRRTQEMQRKVAEAERRMREMAQRSDDSGVIAEINRQIAAMKSAAAARIGAIQLQNTKMTNDIKKTVDDMIKTAAEEADKARKNAEKAAEGAADTLGGLGDFLGGNNLIVYGFLAVLLIMMVRR